MNNFDDSAEELSAGERNLPPSIMMAMGTYFNKEGNMAASTQAVDDNNGLGGRGYRSSTYAPTYLSNATGRVPKSSLITQDDIQLNHNAKPSSQDEQFDNDTLLFRRTNFQGGHPNVFTDQQHRPLHSVIQRSADVLATNHHHEPATNQQQQLTALSVFRHNEELANEVRRLEAQLLQERRDNELLHQTALEMVNLYCPPQEFLPPEFYKGNREVIDAINDYALLYRHFTTLILQEGTKAKPQKSKTLSPSRQEETGGRITMNQRQQLETILYLKERVSALTAQTMNLKQELAEKR